MANPKQLDILKQGVEVWNRWREENPEMSPDLAEADLSMTDLGGVDLSMTDLREVDLCGASLTFANLHGAKNLSQTKNLREADLGAAYLRLDVRLVTREDILCNHPAQVDLQPSMFRKIRL